jgi:hypothetical protein
MSMKSLSLAVAMLVSAAALPFGDVANARGEGKGGGDTGTSSGPAGSNSGGNGSDTYGAMAAVPNITFNPNVRRPPPAIQQFSRRPAIRQGLCANSLTGPASFECANQ